MAVPENVLNLDHAPVVGRTYLVPTVEWPWDGLLSEWPVIQPAPHMDVPEINDWHIDYRFLTGRQEEHAAACERREAAWSHMPISADPNWWPGSRAARQFTLIRPGWDPAFPSSVFRRLLCRRPTVAPEPLAVPWHALSEEFGEPAEAIVTSRGRFLCPHQKMDLTHWPREADGTVICPLHRLRVRCPAGEA